MAGRSNVMLSVDDEELAALRVGQHGGPHAERRRCGRAQRGLGPAGPWLPGPPGPPVGGNRNFERSGIFMPGGSWPGRPKPPSPPGNARVSPGGNAAGCAAARTATGSATLTALAGFALLAGLGRAPRAHARQATHARHLLHHLASFEEAVDEAVHLGDGDTGALRDANPARAVDDLRVFAFGRCHRANDGRDAVDVLVIDLRDLLLQLPHARQHAEQVADRDPSCEASSSARGSPRASAHLR